MKLKHHSLMNDCAKSVAWKLSVALVVALVCLAASILVIFPVKDGPFIVIASKLGLPTTTQRFPKGQLQADAKTLLATLEWWFSPDVRLTNQPVRDMSAAAANSAPT